ncbi:hypothetical protein [Arthrobacter cryoconiti]|uniref:Uncharacterized protein n=1 Tax=Arthrobacter cryoconiti TaxID=748907 RepID=A0ABV8R1P3_9MICC|nr:hypothetical protein [Arthrobacter cryoconiti]
MSFGVLLVSGDGQKLRAPQKGSFINSLLPWHTAILAILPIIENDTAQLWAALPRSQDSLDKDRSRLVDGGSAGLGRYLGPEQYIFHD